MFFNLVIWFGLLTLLVFPAWHSLSILIASSYLTLSLREGKCWCHKSQIYPLMQAERLNFIDIISTMSFNFNCDPHSAKCKWCCLERKPSVSFLTMESSKQRWMRPVRERWGVRKCGGVCSQRDDHLTLSKKAKYIFTNVGLFLPVISTEQAFWN